MTLEQRLKIIKEEWYSEYATEILIQALRKAIEQRDRWIIAVYGYKSSWSIDDDKELLEILESK